MQKNIYFRKFCYNLDGENMENNRIVNTIIILIEVLIASQLGDFIARKLFEPNFFVVLLFTMTIYFGLMVIENIIRKKLNKEKR